MFIARSLVFYPGYFEDSCKELSDEIILPSYYLNRIMEEFEDDEMLYTNLTNTETDQTYLVALGSSHNYDKNTVYAPQWILDLIGCTGICDSVITVEKADVIDIPSATKIIIKPLDPIAFEIDTVACFEKAFMNLHSIREGTTFPIPIPELGEGYTIFAHIEKVEPDSLCRIINGEVDVEFINEFTTPLPVLDESNNIPLYNNQIVTPIDSPVEELSNEERRRRVRESWLKRCQNNVERQ